MNGITFELDCRRCTVSKIMAYLHFLDAKGVLDINGNGRYDALTDGLLILRKMSGFDEANLFNGAIATDCPSPCDIGVMIDRLSAYMP